MFVHNTRTYVRLLGPCFKTGHLTPFVAKASSTMRFSHHKKDLLRSIDTCELLIIAPTIAQKPPEKHQANARASPHHHHPWVWPHKWQWQSSFPHATQHLKQNDPCPQRSPRWIYGECLATACFYEISSVFLTVKKSAQGSSLLFAQKKLLLNNNLWVLPCQRIEKLMLAHLLNKSAPISIAPKTSNFSHNKWWDLQGSCPPCHQMILSHKNEHQFAQQDNELNLSNRGVLRLVETKGTNRSVKRFPLNNFKYF